MSRQATKGRPRLDKDAARVRIAVLRMAPSEHYLLTQAATAAGLPIATWVRMVALGAAKTSAIASDRREQA